MIKRTIEISAEPAYLTVRLDQLKIIREGESPANARSVPCEDIGLVVVDEPRTSYSHSALVKIIEFGGALVVCGRSHLPTGLLLPLSTHTETVWRIEDQIAVKKPVKKRLWKQIVEAKVRSQALNLPEDSVGRRRLARLARVVRSDDAGNVEAQAAKVYWSAWCAEFAPEFRRQTDGQDPLNSMLNYGYAILRAAVGRAIVSAGFMPAIGIHHSNRSNAFCLADDLIEPLRPIIDARVRWLYQRDHRDLHQLTKAGLLDRLTITVRCGDFTGPLMVALHRMTASLGQCFRGESTKLLIPERIGRGGVA